MAIFIFEDDIIQGEQLKQRIIDICKSEKIENSDILLTHRVENILNSISNEVNIYFLDINIHGNQFKGFDVAKEIRIIDPSGIIVFVTIYSNFAQLSYGYMVSAINFIDKNASIDDFYSEIKKCLVTYGKTIQDSHSNNYITIKTAPFFIKIRTDDIIFFEIVGPHKIEVNTSNRKLLFSADLIEFEHLKSELVRCHQSFIINIHHILEFNKDDRLIIMSDKTNIPVSKRKLRMIKKTLSDYQI